MIPNFKKKKSIIELIEVDMNENLGLTYLCPNFNMIINNFTKYIKLIIQVRGYENFQGNNALTAVSENYSTVPLGIKERIDLLIYLHTKVFTLP